MNEELNRALEQISDGHLNEAIQYNKKRFPWLRAIAAVLVLAICWGALWHEFGAEPSVNLGNGIQNAEPGSYYYFESIEEIQALLDAAKLDDRQFQDYIYDMSFRPYCDVATLRQGVQNFELLLNAAPLPCVNGKFDSLRYYLYNNTLEIFCDHQGIRYHFLVNASPIGHSGSPMITGAELDGSSFDLYNVNDRLYGGFNYNGCHIRAGALTDDPSKVDFSTFELKKFSAKQDPSRPVTPLKPIGPVITPLSHQVAAPVYPQMAQCPNYADYGYGNYNAYEVDWLEWYKSRNEQYDQPQGYADSLTNFWARSIPEFLSGEGNRAYSPVNVYLALAMLAEVTSGESRQQVLNLLGAESIEALRTQAGHVWNAHYCNDGETTSLLAISLWLDDAYGFKTDAIQTLADSYYASVFHGDLGTDEMNKQLQQWLNEQTGGLLEEQSENTKMEPSTVFALASTLYFAAGWDAEFSEKDTADSVFHAKNEDLTVPFMNQADEMGVYYWGEDFGAVCLYLTSGSMWLILPDEGKTVEDVLASSEYLEMTRSPAAWKNKKSLKVNLSMPKFDISSQTDLIEGMKKLGLTDVFISSKSDFSPMTDAMELYVSKIDHAVRVAVDEEGVLAAAYTVIMTEPGGVPSIPDDEIDFVLDRPFMFVVSSRNALPLFAGVVEQP